MMSRCCSSSGAEFTFAMHIMWLGTGTSGHSPHVLGIAHKGKGTARALQCDKPLKASNRTCKARLYSSYMGSYSLLRCTRSLGIVLGVVHVCELCILLGCDCVFRSTRSCDRVYTVR